jgi:hypothetical protein
MELARHVLASVVHELGGIAVALDLRAGVMSGTISAEDSAALRGLVEELRFATRAIRLVRGPDGSGALDPARRQSVAEWWRLTLRLVSSVLPKGVSVDARVDDGLLDAEEASSLAWLLLAGFKELAARGIITPSSVAVRVITAGGDGTTVAVEIDSDKVSSGDDESARWKGYAARLAAQRDMSPPRWEQDGSRFRWTCTSKRV